LQRGYKRNLWALRKWGEPRVAKKKRLVDKSRRDRTQPVFFRNRLRGGGEGRRCLGTREKKRKK